jgi:hypothetical protein
LVIPQPFIDLSNVAIALRRRPEQPVFDFTDTWTPAAGVWIPDLGANAANAFIPEDQLLSVSPEQTEVSRVLHFMIFFVSNNCLSSADYQLTSTVIKWLQQEDNVNLLQILLSVGGPTADAAAEKLFPFALRGRNASIVKVFTDRGSDPDISLGHGFSKNISALGLACMGEDLKLVQVLLAAGANANKPSECGEDYDDDHIQAHQPPIVLAIQER